jgi:excisionase family DNA binding protein
VKFDLSLVGIGLYTVAEAARLTGVSNQKIVRWLRGHTIGDREYARLWRSQVDLGANEALYLGFLDLVQIRVASAFVKEGLSPQKVRKAIEQGSEIIHCDYPFASAWFRTDGKTVILHVLQQGEDDRLIDLFQSGQYLMHRIIEPSLKGLEFEQDFAARWWPLGRSRGIVIDPKRQFGQPIDDATGVPTVVLARASEAEGSIEGAARRFMVPASSVRRAVAYEGRQAA